MQKNINNILFNNIIYKINNNKFIVSEEFIDSLKSIKNVAITENSEFSGLINKLLLYQKNDIIFYLSFDFLFRKILFKYNNLTIDDDNIMKLDIEEQLTTTLKEIFIYFVIDLFKKNNPEILKVDFIKFENKLIEAVTGSYKFQIKNLLDDNMFYEIKNLNNKNITLVKNIDFVELLLNNKIVILSDTKIKTFKK